MARGVGNRFSGFSSEETAEAVGATHRNAKHPAEAER
jgi:hypothetical protein